MKISEFLKLNLLELEPDKSLDFKTWISIFCGTGLNNLQKIDDFASDISQAVTVIKNSPSIVFIDAKKQDDSLYTAVTPTIPPKKTDLIIDGTYIIKFDSENKTIAISIKINNTIEKQLKKISNIGALCDFDVGDISRGQEHIFRYDGEFLVLINTNALTFMNKKIDSFVLKDDVIDNLSSINTDVPLSAFQGKLIDERITSISEDFVTHSSDKINPHDVTQTQVGLSNLSNDSQVKRSEMGTPNGVATLDDDGIISIVQLPSSVHDVLEFKLKSQLPTPGMPSKIYIIYDDSKANNGTYRWSGTEYIQISNPLDIATQKDALDGVDNTKAMTPLRVKESIKHNATLDDVTITKIDNTFSSIGILESNKNAVNKFWCGTKAEYLALGEDISDNTTYIVTDEV